MMQPKLFYVVGETTLTIKCLEMLLEKKQNILAVVTNDQRVALFSQNNSITVYNNLKDFTNNCAKNNKADYLLSIVNYLKLNEDVLSLAKKSINYHDAPLPYYAGINSTCWAVYNKEKKHGITWHEMSETIDAGNILKQEEFEIDPNYETTFSLNLKCYQAAIATFKVLIEELINDQYISKKQEMDKRSYYAASKKIEGNGWIDWNDSAENIERAFRALSHDKKNNPLGTLKFFINKTAYIVDQLVIDDNQSNVSNGKITKINDKVMHISTNTKDIKLNNVKEINGNTTSIKKIKLKHQLTTSTLLESPTKNLQKQYQQVSTDISKNEKFWVTQISQSTHIEIPFLLNKKAKLGNDKEILVNELTIKPKLIDEIKKNLQREYTAQNIILAIVFIYLYRLTRDNTVRVDLLEQSDLYQNKLLPLLSNHKPLVLSLNKKFHFQEVIKLLTEKIDQIKKGGHFLLDIYARYPENIPSFDYRNIAVITENSKIEEIKNNNHTITFLIKKNSIYIYAKKTLLTNKLKCILLNSTTHIKQLTTSVKNSEFTPIVALEMFTEEQKNIILREWNKTSTIALENQLITELFEQQVNKNSKTVALVFKDEKINYDQLNKKANQLANLLINDHVKIGSHVGLCLNRSIEMIIALLGILKSGAVYVPIDPETPKLRKNFIIKNNNIKLVIDTENYKEIFQRIEKFPTSNVSINRKAVNTAYVLHTSGSTGQPKGVMVTHKNFINTIAVKIKEFMISESDTLLNFFSSAFDVSLWEIFAALLSGAKLILSDKISLTPGVNLNNFLRENHITIATLTPSVLEITPENNLPKLKLLISTGEACREKIVKKWAVDRKMINAYGPTETTIFATMAQCKPNQVINIGKPISNVKAYVLDSLMVPVPVGSVGELYIGGAGVSRGYLNQNELTKQHFVSSDVDGSSHSLLYKTGDYVKWLPNGAIEYVGRKDEQVKFLGIRTELAEIEVLLRKFSNIDQAVVCHRYHSGSQQLEAFYTTKNSVKIDIGSLRVFLEKSLPLNLIPAHFVKIDRMPLTLSGKIDRNFLKIEKYTTTETEIVKPISNNEKTIIQIFKKVFNNNRINSTQDNFFSLGGDSISAMRIVAHLTDLGYSISIKEIYDFPTVEMLSCQLKKNLQPKKSQIKLNSSFSLSPIQSWFFDQEFFCPNQFSQICVLNLSNSINVSHLKKSFKKLIASCFSLNLRFTNGKNWQQHYTKHRNDENIIEEILIPEDQFQLTEQYFQETKNLLHNHFELNNGALVKAFLINTKPKAKLLIAIHHLIVDGVSWRIILTELEKIYFGRTEDLKRTSASYQEWIETLYQYDFSNEKNFWLKSISKNMNVPIDYSCSDNLEKYAASYQININEQQLNELHEIAKNQETDLYQTLIAILSKVMSTWTKEKTIVMDLESHGRESFIKNLNLSQTIGWFTSLYPFKLSDIPKSLLDIIERVKQEFIELPNKGISYGALRYIKKSLPAHNTSQICFNYWGNIDELSFKNFCDLEELQLFSHQENKRMHLLTVDAIVKKKSLVVTWQFSRNHHKLSTIKKLACDYLENVALLIKENKTNKKVPSTYGLSTLQEGLLFHHTKAPSSEAYIIQVVWKNKQSDIINIENLKNSWAILIKRHSILRTFFHWSSSAKASQTVLQQANLPWFEYNWGTENNKHAINKRLKDFLAIDRQSGFDLEKAPLLRVTLIHLPENKFIMVTTTHHIALDGWSLAIIFDELSTIYKALSKNQHHGLPKPTPFKEHIDSLEQQPLTSSKKFWRDYLANFLAPTLPHFINANQNESELVNIITKKLLISGKVSEKIQKFCKRNALTVNHFFQGAWALMLSHYSQEEDIVFGITITQRNPNFSNFDSIVGLSINTIPLRIKIQKDKHNVLTYLKSIKKNFFSVSEHHFLSLAELKQYCAPSYDHPMLFNTLLIFENYPVTNNTEFSLKSSEIIDPTHYPLTAKIIPNKKLTIILSFDTNRINNNILGYFSENLSVLISEMINKPNTLLNQLDLISLNEKEKILSTWNNTNKSHATNDIITWFEYQVKQTPNKIALVFKEKNISYQELNQKSNQLAHYLVEKGVMKENLIAILTDRCPEMIIAMLATMKVGAAYVPINYTNPESRIINSIKNCSPKIIITKKTIWKLKSYLCNKQQSIFFIDESQEPNNQPRANLDIKINPNQTAYLIYTSGTSGEPKGVCIKHESLANFLHAIQSQLNISAKDIYLNLTSISFDISFLEIYLPIVTGALCIIAEDKVVKDGNALKQLLEKHKISVLQATPITWRMLITANWEGKIKKAICGGERLSTSLAQTLLQHTNQLWNAYGPTETTIWSTLYKLPKKNFKGKPIPIGKPLANTAVYVLDSWQKPVAIGTIGELYISGIGVAKGYFKKNKITQQHFININLSGIDTICYKTGDLVRWLPNGNLEYIDRTDDQIKLNGFRTELSEIQYYVGCHHAVLENIVIYDPSTNQLIVYYTIKPEQKADEKELKTFLRTKIPSNVIPSYFIKIAQFPVNANGKIEKSLLPSPQQYLSEKTEKINIEDPIEKKIATLWSDLLVVAPTKSQDNFFELGGNSLSALQLLNKIKAVFNVNVAVNELFTAATVEELANIIKALKKNNEISQITRQHATATTTINHCLIPLKPSGTKPPLFLIHPVGGTVFWYVPLIKYIDPAQPVYAIQDPGIEHPHITFNSVEEMAIFYVNVIKKVQPRGAYLLGGASAGANISVAMANHLDSLNEEVVFIGLFDGWAYYPQDLMHQEFFETLMRKQHRSMQHLFKAKNISSSEKLLTLQWQRSQMNNTYKPPCLSQQMTLFKANELLPFFKSIEEPFNHWQAYSKQAIVKYPVPGNHETMFQEPHVAVLAYNLNNCLTKIMIKQTITT